MKRYQSLWIIMTTIVLAIVSHAYILFRFFKDGLLFTGPNDGMEQMVPIQMFLYRKWSEGTFFYSTDFGLGGDFFTDLSYYFSTNILFIINALLIWVIAQWHWIDTESLMFWFSNALIVSIIKSILIMLATYCYGRYLKMNTYISMLFAFLFAASPLYFRFTVYWPFFSDVFILLPLLLLSIERYLKSGKIGLFIVVTALSFINNFYFAYYQVLAGLVYFVLRLIFRHRQDIYHRFYTTWTMVIASMLGVGISLFAFFHGARSFINNERIPYETHIPLLEPLNENNNIFIDNYLIVILYIVIQALLTFKLYRHFYFRLFAILSLIAIIASFSPYVDHIFNGFSAPQKRWHYLIAFVTSGLVASYVQYFKSVSVKTYLLTSIPGLLTIIISAIFYQQFVAWFIIIPFVFLIGWLVLLQQNTSHKWLGTHALTWYLVSIGVLMLGISYVFIHRQIFHEDHEARANSQYVNQSLYNTPLQNALVDDMKSATDTDERIDWRVNEQDNTPMYQNFKGLSLYSSIFDRSLIDLYYNQLMINLKQESVSRYQSTGGRANIASLLSVRYQMLKEYQDNLPNFFKHVQSSGQYHIYENTMSLPAVRITDQYYNADSLTTPIDREHAMIQGVVLSNKGENKKDTAPNLLKETSITTSQAKWANGQLDVKEANGGVTIQLPQSVAERYDDFYITLYAKRGLPDSNSTITVNGYNNQRLFNDSTYKTGQNHLLYRTKPDKNNQVHIQISPKGPYTFKLNGIYGEDYSTLKKANKEKQYTYQEKNDSIDINLKKHQSGMAVINIPYRQGMQATVDGEKVPVQKVNYFMIGIPVDQAAQHIQITYRPPYFIWMIGVSVVSLILSVLYCRIINKKIKRK